MTGSEICNLIDSLKARGIPDSEIINIIYEIEGRRSVPQKPDEEDGDLPFC